MSYHTLRIILGDQLNGAHSWFATVDEGILYLIAEIRQETDYVAHHAQKVCAFFLAMQQFAETLQHQGHNVTHLTLDDTAVYYNFPDLIYQLCDQHDIVQVQYQRPDEYRLREQFNSLTHDGVTFQECDTEHFLLSFHEIPQLFTPRKHQTMEFFYRTMRKRFDVLMEDDKPEGGAWNYDKDNRQAIKADDLSLIPDPKLFLNDAKDVLARIKRHKVKTIGRANEKLIWPVNHQQAERLLEYFCEVCLPNFGRFQDAMTSESEHAWSLFHSRLSFAINSKLLHPMTVIDTAVTHYRMNDDISLAQIEGFVRQILGWREYIRGVYWVNMPDYASRNALQGRRALPAFFWSGDTRMHCLQQAIGQSLDYAFAHHIQRLMVTGNFSLLAGLNPDEVDAWYLGIYIDAIEWVELPNTRGMALFADGGIVGTKPYAASGAYINRMSDYCKQCQYNVKTKTEVDSCPLNSLYWHFIDRHRDRFETNPRMKMIYRSWDRQSAVEKKAILDKAAHTLKHIDAL